MGKSFNTGTLVNGLSIDTNGNVGINTVNPDFGSFGATEKILGISNSSSRARLQFQNTSTGTSGVSGTIAFFNSTTQLASLDILADGATNRGAYIFNTNNGTSNAERVRITSSGNVGIGTSSPGSKLSVSGDVSITAGTSSIFAFGIDHQSTFAFGSTNGKRVAVIRDATAGDNGLQFGYDTTDKTGIIAGSATSAGCGIDFYTFNGSAWGNRMRITSGGNVGIGTTSPNFTLDVNGRMRANGITSSTGSVSSVNSGTAYGIINVTTRGIYYIFAQLPAGTGDVTNYTSMVIVLSDGSAAKIVANYSAPLLPLTLSGTLISVSQNSGALQPSIVWNFTSQN
jgi:hypothetical protein